LTQKISEATANALYASIAALQTPFNIYSANDIGTTNAIVANANPAYTSRVGSRIYVSIANSNTGPTTAAINTIPPAPVYILTPGGFVPLNGGEMTAPGIYVLYGIASPAGWQLMNPNPQAVITPQVVTAWNGSSSPVAVTHGFGNSIASGQISQIAEYTRVTFSNTGFQTIAASGSPTPQKIQFNSVVNDSNGWWDGTNFWIKPTQPGTYRLSGCVNSIGTSALQILLIIDNLGNTRFAIPGLPTNTGEPMPLIMPSITITADGINSYFYFAWVNTSSLLSTRLGTDGVTGLPGVDTNFFELKYEGA
jgi:hypothetical protein